MARRENIPRGPKDQNRFVDVIRKPVPVEKIATGKSYEKVPKVGNPRTQKWAVKTRWQRDCLGCIESEIASTTFSEKSFY
jgi:hypothetical protein